MSSSDSAALEALRDAFDLPVLEEVVPAAFREDHGLGRPTQYGIAVASLARSCARAEDLGGGPFLRGTIPAPGWTELGRPRRGVWLEVAVMRLGEVEVELLGPGRGTRFYADALGGREAVLHHAGFHESGVERLGTSFLSAGHAEAVRGGVRLGPLCAFEFRYFDTRDALGIYAEVLDFSWLGARPLDLSPALAAFRRGARFWRRRLGGLR